MKKRILIHAYNVISLLSAILIAICLPIVVIMGEYWKATRPCLMMFLFSIVPIVCSSFIFFLSALPGEWKVKHFDVRRILESVLIICCCFSALDFFFEMRIEYIGFFGLLSADMEKLLSLAFYIILLLFLKTNHYYWRFATIVIGTANIIYIPVFNNLFFHKPFNLREVCFMLPFFIWILALCLFTSLEHSVYSSIPAKRVSEDEYYIGRFIDSENNCYAILQSFYRESKPLYIYSFKRDKKWEISSFITDTEILKSKEDEKLFCDTMNTCIIENYKNEKDLL